MLRGQIGEKGEELLAVPHQLGPLDGSLYAQVRKRSSEEGTSLTSPDPGDPTLSASDDSGLSLSTQWTAAAASRSSGREWGQDQRVRARRLLSGLALELMQPPLEVTTELFVPSAGVEGGMTGEKAGVGQLVNGQDSSCERETDILDDNEEEDPEEASPSLHRPSSSIGCLYSESLPDALGLVHDGGYSTHTWVQQQQVVDGHLITCQPVDGEERTGLETMPLLAAPHTPPRGKSSREAMERVVGGEEGSDVTHTTHSTHTPPVSEAACREDELESLATDIDESIEQLNLLILDLDPTFVPVPTRSGPSSRSASFHTNGLRHVGPARLPGWQHHQASDVTDFSDLRSPGWRGGGTSSYRNSPTYSPSQASSQFGHLYPMDSVDSGRTTPLTDSSYIVPPTPAFPVSPPTPYMKNFPEFSQLSSGGLWEGHRTLQDSRSFLDSLSHSGGSADTDPFRAEVSVPPASYQRSFGSTRSMSSGSPLPHIDSSSPPPVWQARSFQPQPSPPLSLSSPDAHSSPRRAPRCLESRAGWREAEEAQSFSLLQGNGGLEHSLLEAMEGLEGLGLGLGLSLGEGVLPPVLPDKRRGVGAELGSRSPSLSGYSSPHSGSSLSIPLPSSMSPEPHRGLSGTPSPGADSFGGKHDTVKFVQDTSKFWYKPEISRDQAIAVLKDREPGFFIVRDSHSFRGAYGLAMKVDTPPPSVVQQNKKVGDLSSELVRHFLIECTSKGVRLKGCPNEPYFGSLTALVCQHSITPLALPCRLILPDRDPLEELSNSTPQTATNSAAELLKQGAACNVWYLGSVELESLTGHQAVQKAAGLTLAMDPPPTSTVVHFKVSAQGITLTDNQRKLFFRRHYTVNTVIFCSLDPQDRKWTRDGCSTAKIFGFVARKSQSGTENVCHLFAEHDPEQPASAIVNFVSKVMIGSHRSK